MDKIFRQEIREPDQNAGIDPLSSLPTGPDNLGAPHAAAASGDGNVPLSPSPSARPNPPVASLRASTMTPPNSRPMSPFGRGSPARKLAYSVFRNTAESPAPLLAADSATRLLTNALVPHIAVYTSEDTDSLVAAKGFPLGLWELLRPFGEAIHGKVTVRDSNGIGRSFDDFSVRFFRLGDQIEAPDPSPGGLGKPHGALSNNTNLGPKPPPVRRPPWSKTVIHETELVVERHLAHAEKAVSRLEHIDSASSALIQDPMSPYYSLYLRRLLSGITASPHETFSHPVACVVGISSRNTDPIGTLRRLYIDSSEGEAQLPPWVEQEYLRYYVLVHDEEADDIARSVALFDQMKRHFGLHCHLLRIRGSQAVETDDDSIPFPQSDWITAQEELSLLRAREEGNDLRFSSNRHVFESDASAIRTFIREMVSQSIIPTMERSVAVWNEQVASRRRGLGGRILNLSRRWGGFSSSRASVTGGGSGGASTSNFDHTKGYYLPQSAEATMRKLADYAFMLRDWKLAHATYDLLRSDYNTDKAWRFYAAANEMTAVSILMNPRSSSSKGTMESVEQLLEAAVYSYQTRCMATYGAARIMLLGIELLRFQGGTSIDEAVRWGVRLLNGKLLGPIGEVLLKERLAVCYSSKRGTATRLISGRRRKAAMWNIMAAESWLEGEWFFQAHGCLDAARRMYSLMPNENGISQFTAASDFLAHLHERTKMGLARRGTSTVDQPGTKSGGTSGIGDSEDPAGVLGIDDESDGTCGVGQRSEMGVIEGQDGAPAHRSRRKSIMKSAATLETAPLRNHTTASAAEKQDGSTKRHLELE